MASIEFGTAKIKNVMRVGAVALIVSSSSALVPEVSATSDGHTLNVEGQALIVRQPNDVFLIVDLQGGLPPNASIAKAKRYLANVGCEIAEERYLKLKGKPIESVLVKDSCLLQLK